MLESYPEFFRRVTKNEILPYQERYGRNPFSSVLLEIPTGLGKTDTVLLPWLYARFHGHSSPTRLIFVLPRQNLTRQTAENARKRCDVAQLQQMSVLELMADSADNYEDLRPDQPAIIVATQDLYFSRALNRGYARRPPRWPIDFALYNQDCLIVLDEIQLMNDALATSTQLAAFRKDYGTFGSTPVVWMSATINREWLRTVDSPDLPTMIHLEDEDREKNVVKRRLNAKKSVSRAPEQCRTPEGCADFARSLHRPATRTLIVANTVPRARQIYAALKPKFPSAILLHSRFRPADRAVAAKCLDEQIPAEGQIVVSTQVLEAGVDITSTALVTDIAPWGSLVQRFGRVNRYGDEIDTEIRWVDQPSYAKQKDPTAPYSPAEIESAIQRISTLRSASPADLPCEDGPEPWQHVLRRVDLLDLFDTTPDLSGNDLDISRFIRATQDNDVYVAWRTWQGDGPPPPATKELVDRELCSVPIGDFREFARKHAAYSWNFALEEWVEVKANQIHPGMLIVTRCAEGGYTPEEGWSPEGKMPVPDLSVSDEAEEGDTNDRKSFPQYRQTLKDHSDRVKEEMEALLGSCKIDDEYAGELRRAAELHDWGKVHDIFQETLHKNDASTDVLAKQCGSERHSVPHFRHELASALAMLQTGESDLAAYLAAAHHDRIRMAIRAMPGEREREGQPVARGIVDGDRLSACELASGVLRPAVELSLSPMTFGAEGRSWSERMVRLRDLIGPFRLAYLEMLLRAADEQASNDPRVKEAACTN